MTLRSQAGRFLVVGVGATLVHILAAWMFLAAGTGAPVANVLAFATAFGVSYLGHRHWTFAQARAALAHSLPRFAVTAFLGFCLNEAILVLLILAGVKAHLALAVSTLCAAGVTFVLSRSWAFRVPSDRQPGGLSRNSR